MVHLKLLLEFSVIPYSIKKEFINTLKEVIWVVMLLNLWVMELKMELNIGYLLTLGMKIGVIKDISKF